MFCLVILVSVAFSFMLVNHLSVSINLNDLFTLLDNQTFGFVFAAVILNILSCKLSTYGYVQVAQNSALYLLVFQFLLLKFLLPL